MTAEGSTNRRQASLESTSLRKQVRHAACRDHRRRSGHSWMSLTYPTRAHGPSRYDGSMASHACRRSTVSLDPPVSTPSSLQEARLELPPQGRQQNLEICLSRKNSWFPQTAARLQMMRSSDRTTIIVNRKLCTPHCRKQLAISIAKRDVEEKVDDHVFGVDMIERRQLWLSIEKPERVRQLQLGRSKPILLAQGRLDRHLLEFAEPGSQSGYIVAEANRCCGSQPRSGSSAVDTSSGGRLPARSVTRFGSTRRSRSTHSGVANTAGIRSCFGQVLPWAGKPRHRPRRRITKSSPAWPITRFWTNVSRASVKSRAGPL